MKAPFIAALVLVASCPTFAQTDPPNNAYNSVVYASGTITTGTVAQNVVWTLTSPRIRCVQNPKSATEDLFVNFGGIASTTTQDLPAGAQVCWPWKGGVSVYGATTSHAFIAFEAR